MFDPRHQSFLPLWAGVEGIGQESGHMGGPRDGKSLGWVDQSLGLVDPLEKEMSTHSSILAWRIPWTEEPGGLQSVESQRVRHD